MTSIALYDSEGTINKEASEAAARQIKYLMVFCVLTLLVLVCLNNLINLTQQIFSFCFLRHREC
jgi:hypothetical protein